VEDSNFVVRQDGTHDHPAMSSKRRRISHAEKAELEALSGLRPKQVAVKLGILPRRVTEFHHHRTRKIVALPVTELKGKYPNNHNNEGYVVDIRNIYHSEQKGILVPDNLIIISNDQLFLEATKVTRCVAGYFCMDGHRRRLKAPAGLLMLATVDQAHTLKPIMWGISNSDECQNAVTGLLAAANALHLKLKGTPIQLQRFMGDASKSIRLGIAAYDSLIELGMCLKHMIEGVREFIRDNGLQSEKKVVESDVYLLSRVPLCYFEDAWRTRGVDGKSCEVAPSKFRNQYYWTVAQIS
jgi:hypothetical protein